MNAVTVRLAVTAADHDAAAIMVGEYVASLPFILDFQDINAELADLAAEYGGDRGALFLAERQPGDAVGVVGVRLIGDRLAELKRMYLRPAARGVGVGRRLALHAVAAARRLGATRLVLDTDTASMPEANALYESLGFVDTVRYRDNPLACARFLALELAASEDAPVVGVVLAGGAATRMGADKPTLDLAGRPLLEHVTAAAAASPVDRVVVAGRLVDGVDSVLDPPGVAGPAAGLLAVLRRWPGHDVVLVGADQPWVDAALLGRLLGLPGDAVVPVAGRRQATCAIYRHACYPVLERLAAADPNPPLQRLLDGVDTTEVTEPAWRSWGEDGRSWRSIDTPQDLAEARQSWRSSKL
ncbi:MAG: GNAT family N-acetyltransferase [Acidimicrobiia bacterium]|nr:GNAT family N-acetyltransferase [Acidimicrobiia bacterium]